VKKLLSFAASLLMALVLVLTHGTQQAAANHFEYLLQDSAMRNWTDTTGKDNWINYWWQQTLASTFWWAETALDVKAGDAVSKWASQMPNQKWTKVTDVARADVKFRESSTACGSNVRGCVFIDTIYNDTTRNAYYVKSWTVYQNSSLATNLTLVHELGHVIGLHERYIDDGSQPKGTCNNSEVTIMDRTDCDPITGPQSIDITRAKNAYEWGQTTNQSVSVSGSQATLTWQDRAAGEYEHEVFVYWWDSASGVWSHVSTVYHQIGIGLMDAGRVMTKVFDRAAANTPVGYYKFCFKTYSYQSQTYGGETCLSQYWLN
jgi:hypothetical protein